MLEQISPSLNRGDSQQFINERVCRHRFVFGSERWLFPLGEKGKSLTSLTGGAMTAADQAELLAPWPRESEHDQVLRNVALPGLHMRADVERGEAAL